ncbi:MAG: hypothetical protein AAF532_11610 [Planctomycetota bacterium]
MFRRVHFKIGPASGAAAVRPAVRRRGAFIVIAVTALSAMMGLMALGLDLAVVSHTQLSMQNAVDAAALAAAQEINSAVASAGESGSDGTGVSDANAIAESAARAMAETVAAANGIYIDPARDVRFGKRTYNEGTDTFGIQWGNGPYNVVEVTARKDNPDSGAPDAEMDLFFAHAIGIQTQTVVTSATAFVEARDIVSVLDFSRSMCYDSTLIGYKSLNASDVRANMADIVAAYGFDLGDLPSVCEWPELNISGDNGTVQFKGDDIYIDCDFQVDEIYIVDEDGNTYWEDNVWQYEISREYDERIVEVWVEQRPSGPWEVATLDEAGIRDAYDLPEWPFDSGSWEHHVEWMWEHWYVNEFPDGYRGKFGVPSFVSYAFLEIPQNWKNPDAWKTPHYPFHAMKNGMSLFCDFLAGLEFGDHLGLVTYDTSSRPETVLSMPEEGINIDISADPITDDYDAIDVMQRHKSAGHYSVATGTGYGIADARDLLHNYSRYGARPTIVLMTDGVANQYPSSFSIPADWNWAELTDYDDDGVADYTTTNLARAYAFYEAKLAVDEGFTIHTLSVGTGADRNFMKALAFMGGGLWFDVPGGDTVAELEDDLLVAYSKIAANVPPPRLLPPQVD